MTPVEELNTSSGPANNPSPNKSTQKAQEEAPYNIAALEGLGRMVYDITEQKDLSRSDTKIIQSETDMTSLMSEAEAAAILVSLSNPVSSPDSAKSVQISPARHTEYLQTSQSDGGLQISPVQQQINIPAFITSRNTPMTIEEHNQYVEGQKSTATSDSEISPYSKSWYVTTSGTRVKRFQIEGTPRPQACRKLFIPASRSDKETSLSLEDNRQCVEQQESSCSYDATTEGSQTSSEHKQEQIPASISSRNTPMTSEEYQQYIEQPGPSSARDEIISPSSRSDPGTFTMDNAAFKVPSTPPEGTTKANPKRRSDPCKPKNYPKSQNIRRSSSLPGVQVLPPPSHLQHIAHHYVPPLGAPFRLTNRPIRPTVQPFISMARSFTRRARNRCPPPAHLHSLKKSYPELPIPQPSDLTMSRNSSIEKENEQQSSEIQTDTGLSMRVSPEVDEWSIEPVQTRGSSSQEQTDQEIPRNMTTPRSNTPCPTTNVSHDVGDQSIHQRRGSSSKEQDDREIPRNVATLHTNTPCPSMNVSRDVGDRSMAQRRGSSSQEQDDREIPRNVATPHPNTAGPSMSASHDRSMHQRRGSSSQEQHERDIRRNVAIPCPSTESRGMGVDAGGSNVQSLGMNTQEYDDQETPRNLELFGTDRAGSSMSVSPHFDVGMSNVRSVVLDITEHNDRGTQSNVATPSALRGSSVDSLDSPENSRMNFDLLEWHIARDEESEEEIVPAERDRHGRQYFGIEELRMLDQVYEVYYTTNPSIVVSADMGEDVFHGQSSEQHFHNLEIRRAMDPAFRQSRLSALMRSNPLPSRFHVPTLGSVAQERIDRFLQNVTPNLATSPVIVSPDMGEQIILMPIPRLIPQDSPERWGEPGAPLLISDCLRRRIPSAHRQPYYPRTSNDVAVGPERINPRPSNEYSSDQGLFHPVTSNPSIPGPSCSAPSHQRPPTCLDGRCCGSEYSNNDSNLVHLSREPHTAGRTERLSNNGPSTADTLSFQPPDRGQSIEDPGSSHPRPPLTFAPCHLRHSRKPKTARTTRSTASRAFYLEPSDQVTVLQEPLNSSSQRPSITGPSSFAPPDPRPSTCRNRRSSVPEFPNNDPNLVLLPSQGPSTAATLILRPPDLVPLVDELPSLVPNDSRSSICRRYSGSETFNNYSSSVHPSREPHPARTTGSIVDPEPFYLESPDQHPFLHEPSISRSSHTRPGTSSFTPSDPMPSTCRGGREPSPARSIDWSSNPGPSTAGALHRGRPDPASLIEGPSNPMLSTIETLNRESLDLDPYMLELSEARLLHPRSSTSIDRGNSNSFERDSSSTIPYEEERSSGSTIQLSDPGSSNPLLPYSGSSNTEPLISVLAQWSSNSELLNLGTWSSLETENSARNDSANSSSEEIYSSSTNSPNIAGMSTQRASFLDPSNLSRIEREMSIFMKTGLYLGTQSKETRNYGSMEERISDRETSSTGPLDLSSYTADLPNSRSSNPRPSTSRDWIEGPSTSATPLNRRTIPGTSIQRICSDPGSSTSRGWENSGAVKKHSKKGKSSNEKRRSSSSKGKYNSGPSNQRTFNPETFNFRPELGQSDLEASEQGSSRSRRSSASCNPRSSSGSTSDKNRDFSSDRKRCGSTSRKKKDEENPLNKIFPLHCVYCHQICNSSAELKFHLEYECYLARRDTNSSIRKKKLDKKDSFK